MNPIAIFTITTLLAFAVWVESYRLRLALRIYTGIKRVNGVLGYSREQSIEVSQNLPLKMNLLGLDYRVAVYSGT